MKKIFLSSLLLVTSHVASAQIQVINYNPDVLAQQSGLTNENINNKSNNTNNNTTPTTSNRLNNNLDNNLNNATNNKEANKVVTSSGVTIQLPDWSSMGSQNVKTDVPPVESDIANNMVNQQTMNGRVQTQELPNSINTQMNNQNLIQNSLPTENASIAPMPNKTNVMVTKKIGQVAPEVNTNKMNTIKDWNRDTINNLEKEGKKDLEKKYANFLEKSTKENAK